MPTTWPPAWNPISALRPIPSYASVKRFSKPTGCSNVPGAVQLTVPAPAKPKPATRPWRCGSYQSEYVNALWHLDHHGSARVLLAKGQWAHPLLLGILDDHSRLAAMPSGTSPRTPRPFVTV